MQGTDPALHEFVSEDAVLTVDGSGGTGYYCRSITSWRYNIGIRSHMSRSMYGAKFVSFTFELWIIPPEYLYFYQ